MTSVEMMCATRETEAGWVRRKAAMGWSVELLGQSRFDQMRLEYALCCYRYWESFRVYELCASILKRASDQVISNDAMEYGGETVWASFLALSQRISDLSDVMHFGRVVHNLYTLFTGLRMDHPEWLPRLMCMCLRSSSSFGACRICPAGLGTEAIIKRVTPAEIQGLLTPMRASEALKQLENGMDISDEVEKEEKKQKQIEEKEQKTEAQKKELQAKQGKKKTKAEKPKGSSCAASGQKRAINAVAAGSSTAASNSTAVVASVTELREVVTSDDKEKSYLAHLSDFWAFLLSKDAKQADEISKMVDLCLAGNYMPSLPINNKQVKGFKIIRKMMKIDVFKHGMIPMTSDLVCMDEDEKELFGDVCTSVDRQVIILEEDG